MNWVKSKFNYFATLYVAISYVFLSNTFYLESNFSILERSSFAFIAGLILINFNPSTSKFVISTPLTLLIFTSGLSLIHFFQEYVVKDFIGFVIVALVATLIANQYSPTLILKGLVLGASILVFWSIVLLVFIGDLSFATSGQFIGPFSHWNSLGLAILPGVAAALSLTKQKKFWEFFRFSFLGTAIFVLILSESRTSWIVALVLLFISVVSMISKKHKYIRASIWAGLGTLFIIAIFNLSLVLNILGKDSSLTGRTQIWQSILTHSFDGGIFGNGWVRNFPNDYPIYIEILMEQNLRVFHAHNDLLQWIVSAGAISALLIIVSYFIIFKTVFINRTVLINNSAIRWLLLGGLQLVLSGLTEPSSFQLPGWLIFCLLLVVATKTKQNTS